jgi:hypothetical protein
MHIINGPAQSSWAICVFIPGFFWAICASKWLELQQ